MNWSYKLGIDAIGLLTQRAKEFTRAASILGVFVVGVLTCVYGGTQIAVLIPNGTTAADAPTTITVPADELPTYEADLQSELYKHAVDPSTGEETDAYTTEFKDGASVTLLDSGINKGAYEITYTAQVPVNIDIQKILNDILPKIIPLFLTLMLYLLLAKFKWTPIRCIGLILVIGLVGSGFGLWPTIWP
jgi:PTS system N-acetylgalactosamine-specific IID component